MRMYRLPIFNLTASVWQGVSFPPDPPTYTVPCQLYVATRVDVDFKPGDRNQFVPPVQLRVPKGTDLRVGDVVEVDTGDGWFYVVRWVDRVHRGFTNEYLAGWSEQLFQHTGPIGTGGMFLGGDAIVSAGAGLHGLGGMLLGGDAFASSHVGPIGRGGIRLGGDAFASSHVGPIGRGGVLLGGEAYAHFGPSIVGRGGILLGGQAGTSPPNYLVGAGGLLLGGVGNVGVSPGTSCATAAPISLGVNYTFTTPTSPNDHWFVVSPAPGPGTLHIRLVSTTGSFSQLTGYFGPCSGLTVISTESIAPACFFWTSTNVGGIYVKIQGLLIGAGTYTFNVDNGVC